mgnify:CR=1 FL=1
MTKLHIAGRMLQIWGWIQISVVVFMLLTAWIASYSKQSTPFVLDEKYYFLIAGIALLTISGILAIVVGRFLKYKKLWCKLTALIISIISFFIFPIGTFFSAIIILHLYQDWNDEAYKI